MATLSIMCVAFVVIFMIEIEEISSSRDHDFDTIINHYVGHDIGKVREYRGYKGKGSVPRIKVDTIVKTKKKYGYGYRVEKNPKGVEKPALFAVNTNPDLLHDPHADEKEVAATLLFSGNDFKNAKYGIPAPRKRKAYKPKKRKKPSYKPPPPKYPEPQKYPAQPPKYPQPTYEQPPKYPQPTYEQPPKYPQSSYEQPHKYPPPLPPPYEDPHQYSPPSYEEPHKYPPPPHEPPKYPPPPHEPLKYPPPPHESPKYPPPPQYEEPPKYPSHSYKEPQGYDNEKLTGILVIPTHIESRPKGDSHYIPPNQGYGPVPKSTYSQQLAQSHDTKDTEYRSHQGGYGQESSYGAPGHEGYPDGFDIGLKLSYKPNDDQGFAAPHDQGYGPTQGYEPQDNYPFEPSYDPPKQPSYEPPSSDSYQNSPYQQQQSYSPPLHTPAPYPTTSGYGTEKATPLSGLLILMAEATKPGEKSKSYAPPSYEHKSGYAHDSYGDKSGYHDDHYKDPYQKKKYKKKPKFSQDEKVVLFY